MVPIRCKPKVIRLSKQDLLKQRASIGAENSRYSFVRVKRRNQPLNNEKSTVKPRSVQILPNNQNRISDSSIHTPRTMGLRSGETTMLSFSNNVCSLNQISMHKNSSITPTKVKDVDILFSLSQLQSIGDKNEKEKKKKRRRRGAMFKMTPCCCCCLITAAIGLILLAAIIAAIILLTTRSTTTTTSTSTTTTTTTSTSTTTTTTSTSTTTTTTSTETTSTTSTTSSTTTTETIASINCSSCSNYCWNQTSATVAGTDSNAISDPRCIYFDANDTMYLCSHNAGYVQKWTVNATSRTAATTNYGDHIDYIAFDKDGYMYTNAHNSDLVRIYPPGSPSGTIIAGAGSSTSGSLNYPVGVAVDDNFTLYIADQANKRVVKREQNATSIVTVINTAGVVTKLSALLLPQHSSDQIYMSDEEGTEVFLWKFNAATPSVIYTNVNDGTTLKKPRGIKLDSDGNLYVADKENKRIVMFCVNSTVGIVVVNLNAKPLDIAFDSQMNLYAVVDTNKVLEFSLL